MKEQEKRYSLFSNIKYAYRTLFQKCPWMWLGIIGIILTGLGGTVIQTATLPVIVASITEHGTLKNYLLVISVMLLVYVLFHFVSRYIGAWSEFYYENTQNREFLMRLLRKSLTADYENVESPSKQRLLTRATHAVHMYRQGESDVFPYTAGDYQPSGNSVVFFDDYHAGLPDSGFHFSYVFREYFFRGIQTKIYFRHDG